MTDHGKEGGRGKGDGLSARTAAFSKRSPARSRAGNQSDPDK
jgi:hypothetical protein